MSKPVVLLVVGPTAIGKSKLAIELAKRLDGEIVNADSRQIYRGMDIGTAKPAVLDRCEATHHLIDIVDPDEDYSLALFLSQARKTIESVFKRGRIPIVVGGTGQYVWGLAEGWQVPDTPPNEKLRDDLESRAATEGVQTLYGELAQLDPVAASRVDGRNVRRVIRALEVYHSVGRRKHLPVRQTPPFELFIIGLTTEREDLYRRIDNRVEVMVDTGWPVEVKGLLEMGYAPELPSMSSIGYQELVGYLMGKITLYESIELIKTRTHKFARQQYNWFKPSDTRICWANSKIDGICYIFDKVEHFLDTRCNSSA